MRAGAFDRRADLRLFVHDQVVEHDDIPVTERRDQDLLERTRNVGLSIGPSNTAGAMSPPRRKPTTTVCVCQWLASE